MTLHNQAPASVFVNMLPISRPRTHHRHMCIFSRLRRFFEGDVFRRETLKNRTPHLIIRG